MTRIIKIINKYYQQIIIFNKYKIINLDNLITLIILKHIKSQDFIQ